MENYNEDELFQLIKSLTKTEKTYFKKYASQHIKGEVNNYVLLFDILEKMVEYNEDLIAQSLHKECFKNLPRLKNYLYENLLKALTMYHADHSLVAQLHDQINRLEVLWGKGLYKQCDKLLKRIKKIAIENDIQFILLEVYSWELKIDYEKLTVFDDFVRFNEISANQFKVIKRIENANIIEHKIKKIILLLHIIGRATTKEQFEIYKELMPDSLLDMNENEMPNDQYKIEYFSLRQLYAVAICDRSSSIEYSDKLFQLYEESPNLIASRLRQYIYHTYNRLFTLLDANKYSQIEKTLKVYKNIPNTYQQYCTDELRIIVEMDSQLIFFLYCEKTGQFNLALNDVEKTMNLLESEKGTFYNKSREIILYFLISYIYFGNNDFKNALKWINKIINYKNLQTLHIYSSAVNFSYIIHFELKNYDLLEYLSKSNNRHFQKNKEHNEFEAAIFSVLKKGLQHIPGNLHEERQLFTNLKEKLIDSNLQENKNGQLIAFNYENWFNSKIENQSLSEITSEKKQQLENVLIKV